MAGSIRERIRSDLTLSDVRSPVAPSGLWVGATTRIRSNRVAVLAGSLLLLLTVLALFGPALSRYAYDALDWQHLAVPPFAVDSHWLGTDRLGRDLFVRGLYGVRLSLLIAVVATAIS